MAKTKEQKLDAIKRVEEGLGSQKSVYFIDFQKLKALELFDLRERTKKAKAVFYVVKKRLAEIAFKNKKIPLSLKELKGQLAIVFGLEDEIAPAKTLYEFSKDHSGPNILGGYLENQFLSGEEVVKLAQLPSRLELLGKLVGVLNAPISRLHYVLTGNLKGLIRVLQAISEK